MLTQEQWKLIEQAARELSLGDDLLERLKVRLRIQTEPEEPAAPTSRETEIMKLIGTASPDRLVHDVRNLLNEVALLKALTEIQAE